MATTLLRFGLWIILLVLAGYVLRESLGDSPTAELLNDTILQNAGIVGAVALIIGAVLGLIQRVASKARKTRCRVCGKQVPHGQTYCRPHLREILETEDRKFHETSLRGRS